MQMPWLGNGRIFATIPVGGGEPGWPFEAHFCNRT